jgi:uncharacterized protein YrrD
MKRGLLASAVEHRPVCFADIRLGVVVDLVLDDSFGRVLGFDVLCGDGRHRYLPLLACEIGEAALAVPSALVLMREEREFYRERGKTLAALRGFPARVDARELGTLVDLVFAPQGEVVELVVESDGECVGVPPGEDLVVGPDALRPAV